MPIREDPPARAELDEVHLCPLIGARSSYSAFASLRSCAHAPCPLRPEEFGDVGLKRPSFFPVSLLH